MLKSPRLKLRLILTIVIVGVLLALGITAQRWLPPLLAFTALNRAAIQDLTNLSQLALFAIAVIGIVASVWRRPRQPDDRPPITPPTQRETPDEVRAEPPIIVRPPPDAATVEQARRRYLQRLYQRCRVLPLADLGGADQADEEITLDSVYIALDTTTRVEVKGDKRKDQALASEREAPLAALDAARETKRLVLLGDPGSGKSTFIQQIAWTLAKTQLETPTAPAFPDWPLGLFPLLIILRDLAPRLAALALDGLSRERQDALLLQAFDQHWRADLQQFNAEDFAAALERLLGEDKAVLILDGLDEVAEGLRDRVRQMVRAVAQAYRVRQITVTCRIRSYTPSSELPGFTVHTVAPLDQDKIGAFVQRWYEAQAALGRIEPAKVAERVDGDDGLRRAALSPDLIELSSNPMLLTTMAIIHQANVTLPDRRVQLYKLAVEVLLNRWHRRKGIAASARLTSVLNDQPKLITVMERLGFEAHATQEALEKQGQPGQPKPESVLLRKNLLAVLERRENLGDVALASEFVDFVDQRAGLLVGYGGDPGSDKPAAYNFPHRTFQEYLAGCHLLDERDLNREFRKRAKSGEFWTLAAKLAAEELLFNRLRKKEVLSLAYDLCPLPTPGDQADWRAALWSGHIATLFDEGEIEHDDELAEGGGAYVARLIPRLLAMVEGNALGPIERVEAGNVLAELGDTRFDPGRWHMPDDGMLGFVHVPAGSFHMGTRKQDVKSAAKILGVSEDWFDDELNDQLIPHGEYLIARYPVTVAQFRAFVQDSDHQPRDPDSLRGVDNHPVRWVTWRDAMAYCAWLTGKLNESDATPIALRDRLRVGWVVTLPTEAEWERAARGNATHNDNPHRIFTWADDRPDPNKANYSETRIGTTSPVGCFPLGVSPAGCLDMLGNVWEWTHSIYKNYPYDEHDGREVESGNESRTLRGGACNNNDRNARCAIRNRNHPDNNNGHNGFRVVVRARSS